jgi:nitrate/TMAO reductase-like tetraheme cytochrome c subunit
MIGMVLVSPLFVEVTSQSWFCNSCHIMNPYYASWKSGPHKEVECIRCHIPPGMGNFVTAKLNGAGQVVDDVLDRTSSKPSAFVSDTACTRSGCHSMEKVKATKIRKKFFFDHGKHLGLEYKGIEVHCTTCHSHVKGDQHFEVNTNACVTCHLIRQPTAAPPVQVASLETIVPRTEGKIPPSTCRTCHDPPANEIDYHGLKVVHSEFVSYGAQCESCHAGVTDHPQKIRDDQCFGCHEFGMEKMTDVDQTHRVHSAGKHKVECFSCHGVTRHGPAAQSMQLDKLECQSCHRGQHSIQQKTYKVDPSTQTSPLLGHEIEGVPAVSPMFLAHVACSGCHTKPRPVSSKPESGATVAAASARSCDNCHKQGAGDQVALWQKNTRAMYDGIFRMLPTPDRQLDSRQKKLVFEARGLLDLVRLDGSWGVHNPRYTQRLLEEAQQKLSEADRPTTAPGTAP